MIEPTPIEPPLRSVHTTSFARLCDTLGITVAVTTYQAGKLVLLRPDCTNGTAVLNTHFRTFHRPMGFAWEPGRFALGTAAEVWEFHDMPALARKMPTENHPTISHDAAFVPRTCHYTGDVQIHEMLWQPATTGGLSELLFINTRFSCICSRSPQFSFQPIWQPPFITALAPEDRCHLNGMCLRDGQLRYATALGNTDTAGGWRNNKSSGGIVMDIPTNQILADGLSMPHSPRWHQGKLWVLESGNGGVGYLDDKTSKYNQICRLPGFTRGLDFAGDFAFIGLSQVRETATFSGIHVAQLPQPDRACGVWIIDLRTGQTIGFVKFTDAVQEIFAVQILKNMRWPEVLSEDPKRVADTYELPNSALEKVPSSLRGD